MRSPRAWFYDLLSHGEPTEVDPDEIVEAGLVGVVEAQLLLVRLQEAGIWATSAEVKANPYVGRNMAQIFCRIADRDAAQRILDEPVYD